MILNHLEYYMYLILRRAGTSTVVGQELEDGARHAKPEMVRGATGAAAKVQGGTDLAKVLRDFGVSPATFFTWNRLISGFKLCRVSVMLYTCLHIHICIWSSRVSDAFF